MDISIITVTWNSAEHIAEQISSVAHAAEGLAYEEIVIDNGSTDSTVDIIKKNSPQIKIITNQENKGFAAANNQGYQEARGEFLLFLNPDMRFLETARLRPNENETTAPQGSLKKWVDWMRARPHVGISGCKLVYEQTVTPNDPERARKGESNGDEESLILLSRVKSFLSDRRSEEDSFDHRQRSLSRPSRDRDDKIVYEFNQLARPRRFPTLFDQGMILLKIPHIFPSVLNKYLYTNFDPNTEQQVDSVRGSCMLARKELLDKLGFAFDPRYYFWYEDVDICKEAYGHGYTVFYTPIVSAVDYVGTSFRKRNIFWKQWQLLKSMAKYFQKWGI